MIIDKYWLCPCRHCMFYQNGKQHPNPNAVDLHYCNKMDQPIILHKGNSYHNANTWIIPCNWRYFEEGMQF